MSAGTIVVAVVAVVEIVTFGDWLKLDFANDRMKRSLPVWFGLFVLQGGLLREYRLVVNVEALR